MILLTSITVAALCAAFVPGVATKPRMSWIERFRSRRQKTATVAYAPPKVSTDDGWTLIQCDDANSFLDWLGKDQEGLPYKPGEAPSLGSHVLIELFDCQGDLLKYEGHVGDAMRDAAVESKATVVAESFHEFKPWGVSGAVVIQESHYTIHTWPEHGYAAVDLFYCGGTVHVHKAVDVLMDRFKPGRIKFLVVRRGRQDEVER